MKQRDAGEDGPNRMKSSGMPKKRIGPNTRASSAF